MKELAVILSFILVSYLYLRITKWYIFTVKQKRHVYWSKAYRFTFWVLVLFNVFLAGRYLWGMV